MNDLEMIEVLQQIKICLKQNERSIALEFIEIEVNNLKGITEEKCKNKNYCEICKNIHCNKNRNADLI